MQTTQKPYLEPNIVIKMESIQVLLYTLIQLLVTVKFGDAILSENGTPKPTTSTPKVTLNYRPSSTVNTGRGTIATYYIPKSDSIIYLSCISSEPNRWIWNTPEEYVRRVEVWKRREDFNGTSTYLSAMTIHLEKPNLNNVNEIDTNLTCTTEVDSATPSHRVTCVRIAQSITPDGEFSFKIGPLTITTVENELFANCTKTLIVPNKSGDKNCKMDLTVDTNEMKGMCEHGATPFSDMCDDLDSCKSKIFVNAENEMCIGHDGNISSVKSSELVALKATNLPLIAYCEQPEVNRGTYISYLTLHPSFGKKRWKDFKFCMNLWMSCLDYDKRDFINLWNNTYVYIMKRALDYNSIRAFVLSQDMDKWNDQIEPMSGRTEFAENETVELACKGVWSLYMQGFRFKVGSPGKWKIVDENHKPKYSTNRQANFHLVTQTITLNATKYGKISFISCEGPVWNSKEWRRFTVDVSVYPAKKPSANLTKVERDNNEVLLNCTYGGWPRPTVTWNFSEPVSFINQTGHTPDDESYSEGKEWSQTRVVKNRKMKVFCFVENLSGTNSVNLELKDRSLFVVYVVVASSLAVAIVALSLVIYYYWRYRRGKILYHIGHQLTREELDEFYNGAAQHSTTYEALLLPYNNDYEINQNELILDGTVLGSGQFGLVLKGTIGPVTVAVKTVKPTANLLYFKSLLSELKTLQFVGAHRNIVNLIGANTTNIRKKEVFLILDFCSNGSLVSFLRICRERFVDFFSDTLQEGKKWPLYENSQEVVLTTGNLITFSCDVASAMEHLASKNVIHGDLAARNVLVTENLRAKVCDFGLSKQLLHYSVYVQRADCPLPLRWMAIESLQDMEFSLASDRWSFGICLWEIFSLADIPYPGVQWSFESYKELQEGYRMAKPTCANDAIYKLMLQCWDAQPQNRPTYDYIIGELKKEEELLT